MIYWSLFKDTERGKIKYIEIPTSIHGTYKNNKTIILFFQYDTRLDQEALKLDYDHDINDINYLDYSIPALVPQIPGCISFQCQFRNM